MGKKLRNKILLPVAVVLIVTVAIISTLNYIIAKNTVMDMVNTEMDTNINNMQAAKDISANITQLVLRRPLKTSEQIPQKDVIMEQGDTDEKSDDDVWSRCAA